MKKLLRFAAPILVLVAGFVIVQVLADARPRPEQVEEEQRLVSLYVDEVQAETVQVTVRTQGEVRPKTEIDLIPQVSGRIVAISENFNSGAAFPAGSLLLKIEDTDYRLALVRAESMVAAARTEVERQLATQDIKEQEWADNKARGEIPTDFALNKTQVAQARAALRSAEAELDQAKLNLERTEIRVPFDGHVRERMVGIGQFVSRDTRLGRVFSTDTVEVRLPLTDTQVAELNLPLGYTAAEYEAAPEVFFSMRMGNSDHEWQGRLVRVSAAVDEETRLIYATAEVRDPYGVAAHQGMPIAVGMFVNARIGAINEQEAFVMPRLALRAENKVYVINEQSRLEIRTVDVLATSEERVVVASGVNPGERVVTSTLPNAVDGMEVEPIVRDGGAGGARNG